jgi:predicted GNAT family N-acyltransferase
MRYCQVEARVITIERIEPDGPLYESERQLRDEVLLKPLGLTVAAFEAAFPGIERRYEHFVALFDHPLGLRVVGCCGLLPDDPEQGEGRLLQMAVDPQCQGEGLGRRLVVAIESRAFGDLGFVRLTCHARVEAALFYGSLGWIPKGEIFEEVGIPHRSMVLDRPEVQLERPN